MSVLDLYTHGMPDLVTPEVAEHETVPDSLTVQVSRWKTSSSPWAIETGTMECDAVSAVLAVDVALASVYTSRIIITQPRPKE